MNKIQVSVIGGASFDKKNEIIAYQLGQLIAQKGYVLVCGGLCGVMEAAAKGAKSENGITVGILPDYDKKSANPYIDIVIPTGLNHSRNIAVASSGDVIIAVGGEYGTLSEICFALKLDIPVITINSWDIPKLRTIKAETPVEALSLAESFILKES
ncbi:MAG: TIGR00725 family protein [Candidatus Muiribacteriota bacterium]